MQILKLGIVTWQHCNEYDPMIPNNYEAIVKQCKSEQEKAREEEVGVDICR